jgi:hypothetical protein
VQRDAICAKIFELGDWCSAEHGRVMKIFQAKLAENERPHYDIEMGAEKPLSEAMRTRVRNFWTPWEDLLQYHTAEQQIGYLRRAFPKEVLDFALGRSEYEGLLPADIRGSWQQLQQRMAGAWSPGLPPAAQQQVDQQQAQQQRARQAQQQQTQQQAPPPPPPPPAEDDGWGTGEPADETPDAGGPAMPDTPAEFNAAGAAQAQQPQQPPTTGAPSTPADAVRSGTVDPAELAKTLDLLNKGSKQVSEGNAGEL